MKRKRYPAVPNVNRPLRMGEEYLVPTYCGTPLIWPPHRDTVLGQVDYHAHPDPRFSLMVSNVRLLVYDLTQIKWERLKVIKEGFEGWMPTNVDYIRPSIREIECNKIGDDGKCPHHGFNMNQVCGKMGVLTCPLHGMRFDEVTGWGLTSGYSELLDMSPGDIDEEYERMMTP